eukprot:COSAG02_NODE_56576_length_285_cov_0.435484_1_plen_76_part_01
MDCVGDMRIEDEAAAGRGTAAGASRRMAGGGAHEEAHAGATLGPSVRAIIDASTPNVVCHSRCRAPARPSSRSHAS